MDTRNWFTYAAGIAFMLVSSVAYLIYTHP